MSSFHNFSTMEEKMKKRQDIIIKSPCKEMTLPKNVALPDFVWEEGLKNHPDKLALVNGATGRSYTYQEGHDSCKKFAIALMALGIEKGDVVALFMPNSPEFIVSLLGVAGIGAITTTINHNSTPYEVSQQLEASNTMLVVTTPFLTDIAENAIKKTSLAKNHPTWWRWIQRLGNLSHISKTDQSGP